MPHDQAEIQQSSNPDPTRSQLYFQRWIFRAVFVQLAIEGFAVEPESGIDPPLDEMNKQHKNLDFGDSCDFLPFLS